jgi:hypothetical protein
VPSAWKPASSTVLRGSAGRGEVMKNATYGSLGAAIGLMMWMWMSSIVVLFGAELNSEIEHQTAVDTTVGRPKPMGSRGAVPVESRHLLKLGIKLLNPLSIHVEHGLRHRAVHINRQCRNLLLVFQSMHPIQELLDTAQRERRNDHFAATRGGVANDARQSPPAIVDFVGPIAVGRLEQEHIGFLDRRRIWKDRPAVPAEVPAEQDGLTRLLNGDPRVRRPEQVARVDELRLYPATASPLITDWLRNCIARSHRRPCTAESRR